MTRRVLAAGLIGTVAGGLLMAGMVVKARSQGVVEGSPYMSSLEGSTDPVDIVLSWGDGQAFVALARDPGLSRPTVFGGPAELAYRAQRPILAYLTLLLSGGRPQASGIALMASVAMSAGLLVAAAVAALDGALRSEVVAVGLLLLPGAYASLSGLEADTLAVGLAVIGLTLWARGRWWWAQSVLLLASLSRETMLLIPIALGLHRVWSERSLRAFAPFTLPLGGWLAWLLLVRGRVGAWPFASGGDRLSTPFAGVGNISGGGIRGDLFVLSIILTIVILALTLRRGPLVWTIAVWVPFATLLGPDVWEAWPNFSRALLAPTVLGVLVLARRGSDPSDDGPLRTATASRRPPPSPAE